jgi:acyl-CoA synthetase (AMP-forming)/AMP-acid ligase II
MPQGNGTALWPLVYDGLARFDPVLWGAGAHVALRDLISASSLDRPVARLAGESVVISTEGQLPAALALIELDGLARRVVLCPPDLSPDHVDAAMAIAEATVLVTDPSFAGSRYPAVERRVLCMPALVPSAGRMKPQTQTEWILLTSGTTGQPKLVSHTLASLCGVIAAGAGRGQPIVWSTFYDIRRYGGLQILLRALLGSASLVLSSAAETTAEFLHRAGGLGVTHISGTPSHWRRALMSPAAQSIAPNYVRLSGEIADQTILDQLKATYPSAKVAHAFAATEAGVGFAVEDGLAGFPARLTEEGSGDVRLKIQDGSLWLRSPLTATRYLGSEHRLDIDDAGFVDTGDVVERRGDRYYFVGRKGGIINVGGRKVHPEEVEAVINGHPSVRMCRVAGRKSPFTGALVVAEVVLQPAPDDDTPERAENLKSEILEACHNVLPAHKVPAAITFVPQLNIAASGKLLRRNG